MAAPHWGFNHESERSIHSPMLLPSHHSLANQLNLPSNHYLNQQANHKNSTVRVNLSLSQAKINNRQIQVLF
jgi:hypothetical protein